ncbi:MAG: cysteine hydrolase [Bacilli bacterium]|jgi:nicotinamidase/pyrazinamidase|nr:cysteine hydrolase [Bacilli bacterium]HHU24233.1 cysteine hydrolase [Acholeplasmataceae bacterium]
MKKLLIVVDFQNDFVDGALGFPGAEKLEEIIVEKIQSYRQNNYEVVFTLDTHQPNYLETEEGRKLPVPHCLEGTKGHELYGKVKDLVIPIDQVFIKETFPSLDLGNYLRGKDFDEIEVCGLVSNICVLSNAVIAKAACPDAQIIIDAKATQSYDSQLHKASLDVMKGLLMEVINYENDK